MWKKTAELSWFFCKTELSSLENLLSESLKTYPPPLRTKKVFLFLVNGIKVSLLIFSILFKILVFDESNAIGWNFHLSEYVYKPFKVNMLGFPFLPLMGILFGFLPGCGPQVVVATFYLNGYIPLSAEIGNAISNDGDALFPAIALAPKAAIIATVYSAIPAIIVAYSYMFIFEL